MTTSVTEGGFLARGGIETLETHKLSLLTRQVHTSFFLYSLTINTLKITNPKHGMPTRHFNIPDAECVASINPKHILNQSRVSIATFEGSLDDPRVALITAFSLGNRGVHTEVWIGDYRVSTFNPGKCVGIMPLKSDFDLTQWHITHIPITDANQATRFIKELLASPAEYSISISEFAMPKMLLDTIDHDLDCCHPEQWDKLFCTQLALLFLRRCAIAGILDIPKEKQRLLWTVNSKGCLPSRLQIITDHMIS